MNNSDAELPRFDCYIWSTVRIKVPNLAAESMEDAVQRLEKMVDNPSFMTSIINIRKPTVGIEYVAWDEDIPVFGIEPAGDTNNLRVYTFSADKNVYVSEPSKESDGTTKNDREPDEKEI